MEDRSLPFEQFATDSTQKYFSFIDDALASLPVTREQLHVMSPFPTVVTDAALRDSLCTLPFMTAAFRQQFRQRLQGLALPSQAIRTEYGRLYCDRLRAEAEARGLHYIDMYTPLLGADGLAAISNADQNHHLVSRHWPLLIAPLEATFGSRHTVAMPPAVSKGSSSSAGVARTPSVAPGGADSNKRLVEWLQLFQVHHQDTAARSTRTVALALYPPWRLLGPILSLAPPPDPSRCCARAR